MMNKRALIDQIKDTVFDLTGEEAINVNMVGSFTEADISRVRFVSRDSDGLVKGFIQDPMYVNRLGGYVVADTDPNFPEAHSAVFFVHSENDAGATVVAIEDRHMKQTQSSDHIKKIRRAVETLSGLVGIAINPLPSVFNMEDVNYVARDESGLIKGFKDRPELDKERNDKRIYVERHGAIFNARGNKTGPCIIELGDYEAEAEAEEETGALDPFAFIEEIILNGNTLVLGKADFDVMKEVYDIVGATVPEKYPLLVIKPNGYGEIKEGSGRMMISFG